MKKAHDGYRQFNVVLSADLSDRLTHAAVSTGRKKVELIRLALDALLPKNPGKRLSQDDMAAELAALNKIQLVDELDDGEWMFCPYFSEDDEGENRRCLHYHQPFSVCRKCPCNPARLRPA